MNIDSKELEKYLDKRIESLSKEIAELDPSTFQYEIKKAELEGRMQAFRLVKAAFCWNQMKVLITVEMSLRIILILLGITLSTAQITALWRVSHENLQPTTHILREI